MHTETYSKNLKGWDRLGDVYVNGRIILKWALNKFDIGYGVDPADSSRML
jgi:hypothetical protein